MKITSLLRGLAALAVIAGGAAAQAQITKDLVVHLPFDNTYDNSRANGVTATPVGTPTFAAGKIGAGSVALTTLADGSTINYVSLSLSDLLNFGSVRDGTAVDFSVAFWCNYTNQVDDPPFISNKDWGSSNNQGWGIFTQGGGNFRVNTTDDTGGNGKQNTTSTPVIRDGTWHHVVVTFARQGSASVYVDGALATTSSLSPVQGPIDPGFPINIGQDGTGAYTDGGSANMENVFMDDLGIWRRALSSGEVAAIYIAGLGGTNLASVPAIVNPYVKSTSPATGQTGVAPLSPVSAVITDGLNLFVTNGAMLILNGTSVPLTFAKTNADTTITYTPTNLLDSGKTTAVLVFGNNATPQGFFTNTWTFTVAPYVTLTPDLAVTPDTGKPGFMFNIFANSAVTTPSNSRAQAALAGVLTDDAGTLLPNLADYNTAGIALGVANPPNPANAPISFEIASTINLNVIGGSSAGDFPNDDQMPGQPAQDGLTDGIAAEILTYVELPAGLTVMGVNCDDGFRTTAGKVPQDQLGALVAGELDGVNGPTDTLFYLKVTQAGVYAFRTLYQNSTGGADIEWFTVKPDGTKVLLNDTANGGLKAYRAATTKTPAYVKYVSPQPVPRQVNQVRSSLVLVLSDADTTVNDATASLTLGGSPVTITKNRSGSTLTLTYAPSTVLFPADLQQAAVSFTDSAGTNISHAFGVMNLKNVVLPAPTIFDDFDSYAEGDVPTGWTGVNFTDTDTAGLNLDDLSSDSYKGWIVVSADRLAGLKSRIFNGPAPGQYSNGVPVTVLASGNMLYAESDVRGGNQVQFLYSKAYNLSSMTNVAIGFGCLYEQNQDSMGAVEYSVDGGKSWLPAVYYLDFADSGGDIRLNADGSVDAVTTFTAPNGDTAVWTDNGVAKGGNYGDGIAAPITQALGQYVAPRENDNSIEGKRFEIYRLASAGGHSDVRLRFAQLGTGSWYFGVDNLGFYEVPAPTGQTVTRVASLVRASGNSLTLSWTGGGQLYESASVNGPWTVSANQSNPQTIAAQGSLKFYRVGP